MNLAHLFKLGTRVLFKNGPPIHLVFFVTNRCNFACSHCFLIESGELNDHSHMLLKLDEIEKVARSVPNLTALSMTGGEPFLRKDYVEIVDTFVEHTALSSISTVTNGFEQKTILPKVERILDKHDVSFFVTLSLDGDKNTHDIIRKRDGSFERALDTLQKLKEIGKGHPNFAVGVNSTYTGENFEDLMSMYDVLEVEKPQFATLNLMRGVHWQDRPENLSMAEYQQLNDRRNAFLAHSVKRDTMLQRLVRAKDKLMVNLLAKTYDQDRWIYPCYGGSLLGILKEDGSVLPCEQISTPFGNVRDTDYDLMTCWNSEAAQKERKMIQDGQCHCTYECVMSSNVLFNPRYYPALLGELIKGGR